MGRVDGRMGGKKKRRKTNECDANTPVSKLPGDFFAVSTGW